MTCVKSIEHQGLCIGVVYVIALDTEECLVGTRVWFDDRCGELAYELDLDCLVLEEESC